VVGKRAKVKRESENERTINTQADDLGIAGVLRAFPDERKGKNVKYAVGEAGMAA
jgi:hypothetical protein